MIIIKNLPLKVQYAYLKRKNKPKFFILNLNNYRNLNEFSLNKSKVEYKKLVEPLIEHIEPLPPDSYHFHYVYYPKTKANVDVNNPCSIIDKFFCDAFTELGKLEDDNYKFIRLVSAEYGEVDKENPRADVYILPYKPFMFIKN